MGGLKRVLFKRSDKQGFIWGIKPKNRFYSFRVLLRDHH